MIGNSLKESCTIRRRVAGARDSLGNVTKAFTDTANVPCRVDPLSGRRVNAPNAGDGNSTGIARVTVATHEMYLEPDVEIAEGDQVIDVVGYGGGVVLELADVVHVGRVAGALGVHHLEVALTAAK